MQQKIERARELLPSIIITVLSMIQALALELYWNRFQESDFLWQGGWLASIGWLQMLVMLLGMLQIWIMYVNLMLRFRWLPAMEDALAPFAIGLMEFSLINLMGAEQLGPWFIALAVVFALSVTANHTTFKRARLDPDNDYFFKHVGPASWRDYRASATFISILALLGIGLWISGDVQWLALCALLFALFALLYQLHLSRQYWLHSMVPDNNEGVTP